MRKILLEQGTPEWLEWRKSGLGSSDIAAIMGKSPFSTAMKIYYEKSGFSEGAKTTHPMSRGSLYEGEARRAFTKKMKREFVPICCCHSDADYFLASLDGYDEKENHIVEIKVPGRKTLDQAAAGELPEYYHIQMQWQMGVCGASLGYFVCYMPETLEMYVVNIPPDINFIRVLQEEAELFWNNFKRGVPPRKEKINENKA
jgi:putative phage-type endonuclease